MGMGKADDELPRSLERLWARAGRPSRGSQRALSLDRVVSAAIEIADAEGLAALSMAHLAKRLGCATMSLYRHVAHKDELFVFMMDTAPGPPPIVDAAARDWRGGLERWARELRTVYYRHPWILQIIAGRPPLEPGQLAWLDSGLRALKGARLGPKQAMSVILLVVNYVRGEAQIATGLLQRQKLTRRQARDMQAWYGRTLARLVDAERFPALAEISAAGVFGREDASGAADFDFGLARLLDGVQVWVKAR